MSVRLFSGTTALVRALCLLALLLVAATLSSGCAPRHSPPGPATQDQEPASLDTSALEPEDAAVFVRPDMEGYDEPPAHSPAEYCSPAPAALAQPRFSLSASSHPLADRLMLLTDPGELAPAWVGFIAVEPDLGRVIYQRDADRLFTPASTMKLVTTAAALEILGPDYRFTTRLLATGPIANGVLAGDLVVVGSGDPSIPSFRNNDPYAVFRDWAEKLKSQGVSSIQGSVVGVDSAFSGDPLGPGWNWDDESFWYAAQVGALNFFDNCVHVTVKAGRSGQPVSWTLNPDNGFVRIVNSSTTTSGEPEVPFEALRRDGENIIDLTGEFRASRRGLTAPVAVDDPSRWFVHSLTRALEESGIRVGFPPKVESGPVTSTALNLVPLFDHRSPPLRDLIRLTNVESHNLYAEVLLRAMGVARCGEGSLEAGTGVVTAWMRSLGVDERSFRMADGSGLSRKNLITPRALATVLVYMADISPNGEAFMGSLPVAGKDGTLSGRMRNTPAEGVLRAKTGSMELVNALAGVTLNGQSNRVVFVMLTNNHVLKSRQVRQLEDEVGALLSQ